MYLCIKEKKTISRISESSLIFSQIHRVMKRRMKWNASKTNKHTLDPLISREMGRINWIAN